MGVQASAVARVVGIATAYQDLRNQSVVFLPQRIALIGQGSTGTTYSSDKWSATSAAAGGARFGYGSPIHNALLRLLPANGDGVGSIPITVYPLSDASGATAAVGDMTPSGTATETKSYKARIGGIESLPFTVPAGAVDVTATCAAAGLAISSVLAMPVNITYAYGTVTSAAGTNSGNGTLTALAVHSGSAPLPGDYSLICNTAVANGGVWTLRDPNGTVISTSITMTPGVGGATVFSNVGSLDFTLTDASNDFAVNDSFTITVPATKITATSKWKGDSANAITIEILGDSVGVAWAITQPTGGATNPTVDGALAQVGGVWETLFLNCLDIDDTTALDTFQEFGEGRWGELVHAPCMVFTGNTEPDRSLATVISDSRKTDRINCQLVAPGSSTLPFIVAASQLARIAVTANDNPPRNYCRLEASGVVPGSDAEQWDYPNRDAAVKAGSSTIEVTDGVVELSDIVTFYHPSGEDPPAYRYVVDIVRIQNAIFNYRLRVNTPDWARAIIIPDGQPTINPDARHPSDLKTELNAATQALGDWAIISDPTSSKKATTAAISATNPKRVDAVVPIQISGNANIISLDLNFGFYFGGV